MTMKQLLGGLLVFAGVALGLYAGVWWAFIGGIVDVVRGATSTPVEGLTIALGVAKFCFSAFIGWICALAMIIPGSAILTNSR